MTITSRAPFIAIVGPPDDYPRGGASVIGRCFSANDHSQLLGHSRDYRSSFAILTHETGHAAGVNHPADNCALVARGSHTWLRGNNDVPRTRCCQSI